MGKKVPNRHISTKENLKSPYSSRSAGYKNIAGFLKFSMFLELIIKCFYVCEADLWLIPLVDDCQCCSITQLEKKKP